MSVYSFNEEEGKWQRYTQVRKGSEDDSEPCYEWVDWSMVNVPVGELIDKWQELISELSQKEVELTEVKTEYAEKEFQIKYVEEINFKELYGRANDDTRNHHVGVVCKNLLDKKQDLELSIDFLKREISLLKQVVGFKRSSTPVVGYPVPNVSFNPTDENLRRIRKEVEKAAKEQIFKAHGDHGNLTLGRKSGDKEK